MGTSYANLFAANIRAARARANLRLLQVTDRMNRLGFASWDDSKLSKVERGKQPLFVGEIFGLAVALECTLNELIGGNTPPDLIVSMPEEFFQVAGVNIRNSAYGYRDYSVSWHGDEPAVIRPASPSSAMAEDKSLFLGGIHPDRIARNAGGDTAIRADHGDAGTGAEGLYVARS